MTQKTQPEAALYFVGDQLLFEHRNHQGAIIRKCLSPDAARQAFTDEPVDSGWLSPQVIRWGQSHMGPWCLQRHDPQRYTLRLNPPILHPTTRTPLHMLCVTLPGLLFLGLKRTYYLWAYRQWKDDLTTLYHAPLPNIHEDGRICFGSARPPIVTGTTIADAWRLFWDSHFNQDLSRHRTRRETGNVLEFLTELHSETEPSRPFPQHELRPTNSTVGDLIRQLAQRTPRGKE